MQKKKDKKYCKVRDHCQFTEECWGVACSIKYSVPKEIPTVFNNGSKFNYHFIINKLAEEFEKQVTCLGENTEKYITSSVPIEKAITRVNKNANNHKNCILQIAIYWQHKISGNCQILSMISLKEFRKLNVNMDTIIKNLKLAELNTESVSASLNAKLLKVILKNANVYFVVITSKKVWWKLKDTIFQ